MTWCGQIMLVPSRRVYANVNFPPKKFKSVPGTLSLTVEAQSTKVCPSKSIEATLNVKNSPRCFLHPLSPSDAVACCFWSIREVNDESDANCKLETHCVKSTAYCASAGTVKVSFPIIVNFKPIAEGDEIIVFKHVFRAGLANVRYILSFAVL